MRVKRGAQAAYLASLVESLQQADPAEHLVLVGDFNAFEFNDGYVDALGVIKGDEAAADQVLPFVDSPMTSLLVDGSQLIADPAQRYSYVYAGRTRARLHSRAFFCGSPADEAISARSLTEVRTTTDPLTGPGSAQAWRRQTRP